MFANLRGLVAITALIAAGHYSAASCCPLCGAADGKTLTGDAADAAMILYGKLSNARPDPKDPYAGQTDLNIEKVVKSHEILAGRKTITLPRFLSTDADYRFIVFCDIYKGQLDVYRGESVKADSRIADYLQGALAIKDKDAATRLRYFFDFMEDKDTAISSDAYKEFVLADYKDVRAIASKLPAETIAGWMRDPNSLGTRNGLYGLLLGHCGKQEHAQLLRRMLEDKEKRTAGVEGMMGGYVLIDPKEGWDYVSACMKNKDLDFPVRHAALRAARFFHDYRSDVVGKERLTPSVLALLQQPDIADLAIEDLRKWGAWDVADQVLDLYTRESHNRPIIRRYILRYALSAPANASPRIAQFLAERKKDSAKLLEEVQEILNLESPKPVSAGAAPATTSPKK